MIVKRKRWRFRKTTPDLSERMGKLRERGLTLKEIAKEVGLAPSTVEYHLDEKYRERRKKESRKYLETHPGKRLPQEWFNKYMTERYRKDPEFRERMKSHVRKSGRKIRLRILGLRRKYLSYNEAIKLYNRERCQIGFKKAWARHKERIFRLRKKVGVDFPLSQG